MWCVPSYYDLKSFFEYTDCAECAPRVWKEPVCVATVATREDIAQHTRPFRCKMTSSRVTLSLEDEACIWCLSTVHGRVWTHQVWQKSPKKTCSFANDRLSGTTLSMQLDSYIFALPLAESRQNWDAKEQHATWVGWTSDEWMETVLRCCRGQVSGVQPVGAFPLIPPLCVCVGVVKGKGGEWNEWELFLYRKQMLVKINDVRKLLIIIMTLWWSPDNNE